MQKGGKERRERGVDGGGKERGKKGHGNERKRVLFTQLGGLVCFIMERRWGGEREMWVLITSSRQR